MVTVFHLQYATVGQTDFGLAYFPARGVFPKRQSPSADQAFFRCRIGS